MSVTRKHDWAAYGRKGGRKRMKALSPEARSALASAGGTARAEKLGPAERKEIASHAGWKASWGRWLLRHHWPGGSAKERREVLEHFGGKRKVEQAIKRYRAARLAQEKAGAKSHLWWKRKRRAGLASDPSVPGPGTTGHLPSLSAGK